MAGASRTHNGLKDNLVVAIGRRLLDGPCRTYSADMRVKVERTGLYTYPDIVIACEPQEFERIQGVETLLNPKIVIEILSESTERYDRGTKFRHFQKLASVMEYILVSQDRMCIERFVRQPDETWVLTTFDEPTSEFALATIPVKIPLAEIYRGLDVEEGPLMAPETSATR
jgi:Uma2 family endonuclease